jgi:hypothetical protein
MSEPLTSFERAARLFKQAEKLGCDTPTEAMIADAIQDAEFDTLHNSEIIAERHGGQPTEVKRLRTALAQIKLTTPYNGGYVKIGEICSSALASSCVATGLQPPCVTGQRSTMVDGGPVSVSPLPADQELALHQHMADSLPVSESPSVLVTCPNCGLFHDPDKTRCTPPAKVFGQRIGGKAPYK